MQALNTSQTKPGVANHLNILARVQNLSASMLSIHDKENTSISATRVKPDTEEVVHDMQRPAVENANCETSVLIEGVSLLTRQTPG